MDTRDPSEISTLANTSSALTWDSAESQSVALSAIARPIRR
jgi:hypothetical protein